MGIVTARDQLDFSKLLLWKLLLSISSLDDALDANYYADWDVTFGDKRREDSYLNTLIVMDDKDKENYIMGNNSEEITNTILLSEDNIKKKKLTKELLEDNRRRAFLANKQKKKLLHKTLERQDKIKYKAHGGEGPDDDTAAIKKNQATTQIQIKREKLKQKRDELQKLNSKSTAPSKKKSNLITVIKNLETEITEIKQLTPDDTDATRREENAKIAKLRRLEREQAHEAHKAEMSKLDDTHNEMVNNPSHMDNREEMDAVHKKHIKDLTTEHNKYLKDKFYAPADQHSDITTTYNANKEALNKAKEDDMNTIHSHTAAIQEEHTKHKGELENLPQKDHKDHKELTKMHHEKLEQIHKEHKMYKYNNSDRVHTQGSHDTKQKIYKRLQELHPERFTNKDGYIQRISNDSESTKQTPTTDTHKESGDAVVSTHHDQPDHTSSELAKKQATAKVATEAAINKHVSHEALAAAKAHGEVLTHHAKDLHAKGKAHLAKAAHHAKAAHKAARNSNHGSGADFKKKQNESNNLIYLEKAIDDEANEPSASTVTFEGHEYKKYGHQEEFISSLEDRLNLLNSPLVGIVNEFYDTIDPLTLTYLNKLIATSIPLIDRIKLYIFLASLIPEFGEAFAMFLETMNPMWLNIYTTSLNHNMQGLFYKHGDVLQTKRAKSLLKSKERTKMLKDGIKKSAFGIDSVTQTPTK